MDKTTGACATGRRKPRRLSRGFTLVSTAINLTIAGVVLAGAWTAFANMRTQWKIANAERMMDQYGASAMKELTDVLSWSWGGVPQTGGRYTRWKIVIDDLVEEHGRMNNWKYRLNNSGQGYHFVELSYQPQRGILWNGQPPDWTMNSGRNNAYLWSGRHARIFEVNSFDQRDRMTVEGLTLEFNPFLNFPINYGNAGDDPAELLKMRRMVVDVQLVMHYTYRTSSALGLFGGTYVRERIFHTQVCLRNWDVEANPFRDTILGNG